MSEEKAPAGAVRLARVAGVPVYLDRTWLLLAAFIAWTGWQNSRGLGAGFVVVYVVSLVLGILVAVLAHEVAHALAGRVLGFRVHRIVATLWGGHTSYDGTGATPARVAGVAAAGPVANLLLAAIGWVAYVALPYPAAELAWSFFFLNTLLAVFNLLPGLPLDGGQLVETVIWRITGRRDRGLVAAGWVGRVIAVGLVLWYLVRPLLRGDRPETVSVLLALVMGWVLWSGATAAINRAPFERLVSSVRVGDVAAPVVAPNPGMTVADARTAQAFVVALDERARPVLVVVAPDDIPPTAPVEAAFLRLADDAVVEAEPGDGLTAVLVAFSSTRAPCVVVTRGGLPWGLVTGEAVEAAAQRLAARN